MHKQNNNYSYDSLRSIIARVAPDVIAVEIRAEDIDADSIYLSRNYPFEMRMMKYWFPDAIVVGFDWLGTDIIGRPIPANYWTEIAAIKKYERALDEDSSYGRSTSACDTFSHLRLNLLKSLSLKDLLNSDDAKLTGQYYECLAGVLKGSMHERVLAFYEERNEKIWANILDILHAYNGKTIVLVTGDDHYIYLDHRLPHDPLF